MQKGMDTLFGLIGEAVWNKLNKHNEASTAKDSTGVTRQDVPTMDAIMAQQQAQLDEFQNINGMPNTNSGMPSMMRDWAGPNQPSNLPPSWYEQYGPPPAPAATPPGKPWGY